MFSRDIIDGSFIVLVMVIAIVIAVAYFVGVLISLPAFYRTYKYIKLEINRTSGSEQMYWKKEKCRLWLSLLPFVRYK